MKKVESQSSPLAVLAAIVLAFGSAVPAFAGDAAPDKKAFDVGSNFRNVCGFCHEDYGRHAGKGPQLMNSERTDQYLFDRIKKGLPGRMAAFGSVYSDDQIGLIVKFIRNLKAGEEPKNP
ncbi:MAG: cytochrome c [Burkholderiales bacterium]